VPSNFPQHSFDHLPASNLQKVPEVFAWQHEDARGNRQELLERLSAHNTGIIVVSHNHHSRDGKPLNGIDDVRHSTRAGWPAYREISESQSGSGVCHPFDYHHWIFHPAPRDEYTSLRSRLCPLPPIFMSHTNPNVVAISILHRKSPRLMPPRLDAAELVE